MSIHFPETAEKLIISALFQHKNFLRAQRAGLKAEHFYVPKHRILFTALAELYEAGRDFESATLIDLLKKHGQYEAVGGDGGLADAIAPSTTYHFHDQSTYQDNYINDIIQAAEERDALLRIKRHVEAWESGQADALTHIADAVAPLQRGNRTGAKPFAHYRTKAWERIERKFLQKTHILGLRSDFWHLDNITGGFQPGNVYVLAARPSMGKTSLATNIIRNISKQPTAPHTLFISAEMSPVPIMERLFAAEAGVDIDSACHGGLTMELSTKLTRACRTLEMTHADIYETNGADIDTIMAECRYLHTIDPLHLIVIDYLQIIPGTTRRSQDSTVDQVAEVSRKVHNLATSLQVPILALAQFNRECADSRPRLQDLKGSGAIEQDADCVILLDRPEKYTDDSAPQNYLQAVKGLTILDVAKNRHGKTGHAALLFTPKHQIFIDHPDQTIPTPPKRRNK